jgi:ribosomal protein S18 acetylase RimI-like enzyme
MAMETLTIKSCSYDELELLAQLNKQLIEDEKHDNAMDITQLTERMKGFLETGYSAYLFCDSSLIIGYALINMKKRPLYLRQFFICRESRRRGYGKRAFCALLDSLGTDTIDLEVLVWNETGKAFWQSLGFKERSVYMRYE